MTSKKETILKVDGMSCGSCVRHVEGALRGLEGVDKVEVALKEGRVRIEHDAERPSMEAMIHAIDEAGYEARGADAG